MTVPVQSRAQHQGSRNSGQTGRGTPRRHIRAATYQDLEVSTAHSGKFVAKLIELSQSGALIEIEAHHLVEGETIAITLLDGTPVEAIVVRATLNQAAIEFDLYLLDPEDHLHIDHLGAEAFFRIARLQKRRQSGPLHPLEKV